MIYVAEMYVCVNTFFIFFFFLSKQSRWNRVRKCTRPHSSSLFRGRIKRNSRRYKFIIVRAEPFFLPNTRGEHFSAISTLSHIQREKELLRHSINCHCCFIYSVIQWDLLKSTNVNIILIIICWILYKFFRWNFVIHLVLQQDDLRYDTLLRQTPEISDVVDAVKVPREHDIIPQYRN